MQPRSARRALISLGTLALVLTIGVGSAAAAGPNSGGRRGGGQGPVTPPATAPAITLTTAQKTALAAMAEEEKLARDLYAAFARQYGVRVFTNIGAAESTHLASMRTLLTRYGVADPTAGRAAGSFADPAIQTLYNTLLARGRTSLAAAYGVGRTVELDDIAKLDAARAGLPSSDVATAYTNLRRGSVSHLAAFNRLLGR